MTASRFLILCLCPFLAGCVGSLHPLYTEKDLVYDPAILGVWTGDGTWTIQCESEPGKSYRIIQKDEDKNCAEYIGHLASIKGNKFLDVVQDKFKDEGISDVFAVPLHVFIQVRSAGEDYEIRLLDYDWLKAYLKKRTGVVKHEIVRDDDLIVLTAKPRGLQRFVLRHLKDGFSDWQLVERSPEKS